MIRLRSFDVKTFNCFVGLAAIILSACLCTPASAGDKLGIGFVPKMGDGDKTEQQLFEIVGEMPEIDQVFVINDCTHMLKTLTSLKSHGKQPAYIVIAGHGSRDTPGIKWGKDDMIPEEIDLEWNKKQLATVEKALQNPKLTQLKPEELKRKQSEFKQSVTLLQSAHGVLAPDGIVLLVNCSAAATPKGQKYVKDFGQLLLGENGGWIIAPRTDVGINLRSSLGQRAWTQVLNGTAFEHPEYLITADWQPFRIDGNLKSLTGRWAWGNKYFDPNGPTIKAPMDIIQKDNNVKLIKRGSGNNDMTFTGQLSGNKITGRWTYLPMLDWSGPFEVTIDDPNHLHGTMSRDNEKGVKTNGAPEDFRAVRRSK